MVALIDPRTLSENWIPLNSPSAAVKWFNLIDGPVDFNLEGEAEAGVPINLQVLYTSPFIYHSINIADSLKPIITNIEQTLGGISFENWKLGLYVDLLGVHILPGYPGNDVFELVIMLDFSWWTMKLGQTSIHYYIGINERKSYVL